MQYELKTRQICFFFIAFLPVTKMFMLPSIISASANEDMWICSLINLILDFITVLSLSLICKNLKTDFKGLLENCFGKTGKIIVLSLYFIYFLLKAFLPFNEQKDYVELTLYLNMPKILYFLPIFVSTFYIATKRLRVFGRLADVFLPITIIGYVLIIALAIPNTDLTAILPIGANGIEKIFNGTLNSFTWFGDCVYLLFFIGNFSYKKRDCLKIILSFIVSAIMVILFMIIFYGIFTSIGFRQRFALTETSKYTTVIANTGRFDYIGITCILLSNIVAMSLPVYFASDILNEIFYIKNKWLSPLIVTAILVLTITVLEEYFYSFENFITNYAGFYFLIFANIVPLFTVLLKKGGKRNEAIKLKN